MPATKRSSSPSKKVRKAPKMSAKDHVGETKRNKEGTWVSVKDKNGIARWRRTTGSSKRRTPKRTISPKRTVRKPTPYRKKVSRPTKRLSKSQQASLEKTFNAILRKCN